MVDGDTRACWESGDITSHPAENGGKCFSNIIFNCYFVLLFPFFFSSGRPPRAVRSRRPCVHGPCVGHRVQVWTAHAHCGHRRGPLHHLQERGGARGVHLRAIQAEATGGGARCRRERLKRLSAGFPTNERRKKRIFGVFEGFFDLYRPQKRCNPANMTLR